MCAAQELVTEEQMTQLMEESKMMKTPPKRSKVEFVGMEELDFSDAYVSIPRNIDWENEDIGRVYWLFGAEEGESQFEDKDGNKKKTIKYKVSKEAPVFDEDEQSLVDPSGEHITWVEGCATTWISKIIKQKGAWPKMVNGMLGFPVKLQSFTPRNRVVTMSHKHKEKPIQPKVKRNLMSTM